MKQQITIAWLYPELMSTYGDRGNIIILQKRCAWRGIECSVLPVNFQTTKHELESVDMFFGGGAQDRQQTILIEDLRKNKGPIMKQMIDAGTPGLFVCGSPQLLGHFYTTADGKKLEGLGIFDMESRHPGYTTPRCIGNTLIEISKQFQVPGVKFRNTIIGFENHGGRTYLGKVKPFGNIIVGKGNNGEDGTEGAVYRNCIATYSHGPFLSKNPHIADWLLARTLNIKYKKTVPLKRLDDAQEWQAHDFMVKRLMKEI